MVEDFEFSVEETFRGLIRIKKSYKNEQGQLQEDAVFDRLLFPAEARRLGKSLLDKFGLDSLLHAPASPHH